MRCCPPALAARSVVRRYFFFPPAILASTSRLEQHEQVFAVDRDLGAAVLRVEDDVAGGDVDGDELAGLLGATARAHGEDFALLGLLLGGVGDDETADGRLLGLSGADDDAVFERLQVHVVLLLV